MRIGVVLLAFVAALTAVGGAPATTAPGKTNRERALLTDTSMKLGTYRVRRGTIVRWSIVNRGRKAHNLVVQGGFRSRIVRPGRTGYLYVQFRVRGLILVRSTVNPAAGLRARVRVY